MIDIKHLSFRYIPERPWLIRDFSLHLDAGGILGIRGCSGSGKTTLLYLLCGVIPAVTAGERNGKVFVNDIDVEKTSLPQLAPHVSLLMQQPDYQLFFPTVEQEIAFGPENLCLPQDEIASRVDEALMQLGIEELRYKTTAKLSFGQKRLVTLAALLALAPRVLLLDEPLGGIHPQLYNRLAQVISQQAAQGTTVVIADHHPALLELAGTTVAMEELR